MWEKLRSIWTVPDLRKKILFTLGMLLIFRILAHITVPLTHAEQQNLLQLFSSNGNQSLCAVARSAGCLFRRVSATVLNRGTGSLSVYYGDHRYAIVAAHYSCTGQYDARGRGRAYALQPDHAYCHRASGVLTGHRQRGSFREIQRLDEFQPV